MKFFSCPLQDPSVLSPSLRGRGLKSEFVAVETAEVETVALFTRAWIEMPMQPQVRSEIVGRPLYEGVD